LTFYYARYTWANVAKQLGYSKDKIAEALGHEYGNKVTGIYLDNYGNEVIDEMNLEVINTTLFSQYVKSCSALDVPKKEEILERLGAD